MSDPAPETPSQELLAEVLRIRSLSAAYWISWCLQAAAKLNLCAELENSPATSAELAQRTGLDPQPLGSLLELLTMESILTRDDSGRYANTPASRAALIPGGLLDQTGNLAHNHAAQALAPRFPDIFQPDFTPAPSGGVAESPESLARAAHSAALLKAPIILPFLELGPNERVVDLGAGSGDYTFLMARERTDLTGTIVDRGAMATAARKLATDYGVADRIRVVDGDFKTVDFGHDHTLALVSHVLHFVPAEVSRTLLRRAFESLAPGGRVVIHDILRERPDNPPPEGELLNLDVILRHRVTTPTCAEAITWLLEAGFADPIITGMPIGPSTLITAAKPH